MDDRPIAALLIGIVGIMISVPVIGMMIRTVINFWVGVFS